MRRAPRGISVEESESLVSDWCLTGHRRSQEKGIYQWVGKEGQIATSTAASEDFLTQLSQCVKFHCRNLFYLPYNMLSKRNFC